MEILSFGAGMQSTALLGMAVENTEGAIVYPEVPKYDAAIFCDLQCEPTWVYKQVAFMQQLCESHGIPFYILEADLYTDHIQRIQNGRYIKMPLWTMQDGKRGRLRRACTIDFKIKLIQQFVKYSLLGYRPYERMLDHDLQAHGMHLGFSAEEQHRIFTSQHPFFINRFPLIDMGLERKDNYRYMLERWGFKTRESSCYICPFHTNYFWGHLKDHWPADYKAALAFDQVLKEKPEFSPVKSELYISKSCKRISDLTDAGYCDAETFFYRGQPVWNGFYGRSFDMNALSVLEKFDEIEIENASRITGEELAFCTAQQALYEKVLQQHRRAYVCLQGLDAAQTTFLRSVADDNVYHKNGTKYHHYGFDYAQIGKEAFALEKIGKVHGKFISIIVRYFTEKYNVTIGKPNYLALMNLEEPVEPEYNFVNFSTQTPDVRESNAQKTRAFEMAKDAFWDTIISTVLDYNTILDHIFVELDGDTFAERVDQEIKSGSRTISRYEIKNKKITMGGILNPIRDFRGIYEVCLDKDKYRAALRALTYFDSDTNVSALYPKWYQFTGYTKYESDGIFDAHEVGCGRVQAFKIYKNGKFEVTFDSHASARQFASEFLRTIEGG